MGIYKGIAYPLGDSLQEFVRDKGDRKILRTSIINILFTWQGERYNQPDIGSEFQEMVFEPNDATTDAELRHIVSRDVEEQDPRIKIVGVHFTMKENNPNQKEVRIQYMDKRTNTQEVDEFSFSVDSEGNLI